MTIPTRQQTDLWHAGYNRQLEATVAGLLDLIDCGSGSASPPGRRPSKREQVATDRASDSDGLFQPTAKGQGRRSPGQRSDPTGRAVEQWELEVQQATTRLYACVSAAADAASSLGLTVLDERGCPVVAPNDPATRRTLSGTLVVNVSPSGCRRAVLRASGYLGAVGDALAGRLAGCSDPEVGDRLLDVASLATRDLRALAGWVGGDGRPLRLCACGCRRPAPPKGEGATRPGCRTRRHRSVA